MAEPLLFNLNTLYSPSTENKVTNNEVKRQMPKRCECSGCNKKLILTDIECKCKKYYCSVHRFSTDHSCNYDYKSDGIKNLEKNLVKVTADKLEKI